MRRIIYPLLACIALLGVAVTPALARQHHRAHERRHHERRHHHARIRHRTFGSAAASAPGSSGPTSSSDENAGTVSSFTNGVLTIALRNGSMVSGAINGNTEIECQGNGAQADQDPGDNDAGENAGERAHDERSGGGGNSSGDDNPGAGDEAQGENDNPGDDNDDNDEMQNCSSSALTQGTVVREAQLTLGSGAARWDKVELLSTGSSASEDS